MKPFYGRLKGKMLRPSQKALLTTLGNELHIHPSQKAFDFMTPQPKRALEIGFGGGEHLVQRLDTDPHYAFLGLEPFENGFVKCLKSLEEKPSLHHRVRLSRDPFHEWTDFLPTTFFDEIFLLFPDPWTKKRHHKRRLLCLESLVIFQRILKNSGKLYLASDEATYISHMHHCLSNQNTFRYKEGIQNLDTQTWPAWPSSWPLTRYGMKAQNQGRPLAFFLWEKTS